MAEAVRSSKCAVVSQPGSTLVEPTAGTDFLALQAGFSLSPQAEILTNDELRGQIAPSKPIIGLESSQFSVSHYLKGSGVVAQAPEENLLLKSVLGAESIASTEYDTIAASTTSVIKVGVGEGATFSVGEALMGKDPVNGYWVRNIYSISGDDLTLAQNVAVAPGVGVNLGRAVLYNGVDSGHEKLSVWCYLGEGAAVLAASKVQINSCTITIDAGQAINAEYAGEGLEMYFDPITIGATSKYIDFTTDAGTVAAILTEKTYRDPVQLADEIALKMDAAAGVAETITCVWNSVGSDKGKFTITASGTAVFSILWNTGANTANSAKTKLGFSNTDDTGALTYKSDSVISWAAPYTPSYDSNDFLVAKDGDLLFGGATDLDCADLQTITVNIADTVTPDNAICALSGRRDNVVTAREVTIDLVAKVNKDDVRYWEKYRSGGQTRFTVNVGKKTGANWTPGQVLNIHSPTATVQSFEIDTTGEFAIINAQLLCYITGDNPEFFINFV